jgi:hypothetical protein
MAGWLSLSSMSGARKPWRVQYPLTWPKSISVAPFHGIWANLSTLDLSEAETREALGIAPGTVKSRLHRAVNITTLVLGNVDVRNL